MQDGIISSEWFDLGPGMKGRFVKRKESKFSKAVLDLLKAANKEKVSFDLKVKANGQD